MLSSCWFLLQTPPLLVLTFSTPQHYSDPDGDVVDSGHQESVRRAPGLPIHQPSHHGHPENQPGHPGYLSNQPGNQNGHPDQNLGGNADDPPDVDQLPATALASISRATATLRQLGPLPTDPLHALRAKAGPALAPLDPLGCPRGSTGTHRPPLDPLRERRSKYSTFDRRKGNGSERRGGVAGGIR